jgi:hypothetical protein
MVPIGCVNQECHCLDGGTIVNGVCTGGGTGGVRELDVWNCLGQSATL